VVTEEGTAMLAAKVVLAVSVLNLLFLISEIAMNVIRAYTG
jgi:hypothetical protein